MAFPHHGCNKNVCAIELNAKIQSRGIHGCKDVPNKILTQLQLNFIFFNSTSYFVNLKGVPEVFSYKIKEIIAGPLGKCFKLPLGTLRPIKKQKTRFRAHIGFVLKVDMIFGLPECILKLEELPHFFS